MTNNNTQHLSKILITTLSILLLTGLGAASIGSAGSPTDLTNGQTSSSHTFSISATQVSGEDSDDWYNISVSSVLDKGATVNSASFSNSGSDDTLVKKAVDSSNQVVAFKVNDGTGSSDSGAVSFDVTIDYDTSSLNDGYSALTYTVNQYDTDSTSTADATSDTSNFGITDSVAPQISSVTGTTNEGGDDTVEVNFDEPVSASDGTWSANEIASLESPDGTTVSLTGATFSYDSSSDSLTITLSEADNNYLKNDGVAITPASNAIVDGGSNYIANSQVTGSVSGDSDAPGVSTATINGDTTVTQSETGTSATVTVNFDEKMDKGISPTVEITGLSQGTTAVSGSFTDDTTWEGTATINDKDEDITSAAIEVSSAEDQAGNTISGTSSTSLTVDTISPSVSVDSGSVPDYFTGNSVDVANYFSITNDDGGTTTYEYSTDGGSTWTQIGTGSSASLDTSTFSDGDTVEIRSTDTDDVGNQDQATTSPVTVDLNAPQINTPSPSDSSVVSDSSTDYTVDLSDGTSGVDTNSITVTVSDSNSSDGKELDAVGTGNQYVDYYSSNSSLEITGLTYVDGQVDVTVNADDQAGNSENTFSSSFTVDTTAPTVSSVSISESDGVVKSGDTVTVSADVTDATSISSVTADASSFGAGSVPLTLDSGTYTGSFNVGSKTAASEGEQSVTVSATDTASNGGSQEVESNNLTVDTTNPSVSVTNPSDGDVVQAQKYLNGSASDSETAVSSVELTISDGNGDTYDGSSFTSTSSTVSATYDSESGTWSYDSSSITTDGSYSLTATATDTAGNSIGSSSVSYTIDSQIETANIQSLSDTVVSNGDTVTVTYDAQDTRFSAAEFIVENSTGDQINSKEVTGTGTGLTADITAPSSEGDYTVKLRVNDTVGNSKTTSGTTFTVDTTAPSPAINSISDQIVQSSTSFDVNYNATDSDISSVTVAIVGSSGDVNTVPGSTGSEVTTSITSPASEGDYSVEVRATDDAGNTETSSQKSLTVDDTPPSVSSIEVVDRNRDGDVDAANVTFSEAVDDSQITAGDWEIGGKSGAAYTVVTGASEDDNMIQVQLPSDNQVSGTAVAEVTYTGTSVKDLAGNQLSDIATADVTEKDEADPVVHYSSGTNMVSFPSKVGLYSLDTLLSNSGNVDAVWRYSNGEWESYEPSKSSSNNDFSKVEGGQGYILKASGSGKIVADVDQGDKDQKSPSGVSIKKDRWNLVGHYEETTEGTLSNIGLSTNIDQVVERDGSGSFTSVAEVNPGDGYWVSAAADKLYEPVFN